MGKVIAVANQKGGVGKTTTAVNLSSCLGKLGKKTLLIDSDPQGNSTSGVGVNPRGIEVSTYDCLINDVKMTDVIIETEFENLYLCPSNINLAGAELELADKEEREFSFRNSVDEIRDDYDFIIIDCPPALGLITVNAFTASDSVMIPIQCEYYALEGLSQLTKTLNIIKSKLNPELEIEGVLPTMFDSRTNLSVEVVDEVKEYFGEKMYPTFIPRNVRLSEAPSFGLPIVEYDKNSKGAESYMLLAEMVIEQNS